MDLIVLTPEQDVPDEAKIINDLFRCGLTRLHVRKHGYTIDRYREYINAIALVYHSHMVIHDSFDLFHELKLGGIHLSSHARNDDKVWDCISEIQPSAISTSFHSWLEIEANNFSYNYVFISPVFDSISKQGYQATIDLSEANKVKQEFSQRSKYLPKIIGLGGVGPDQLEELSINGFDGAAMLGAIWLSKNPVNTFINAMNIVNTMKTH